MLLHTHDLKQRNTFFSALKTRNRTPVYAGGAFAVSRNYFLKLGGHDPDLELLGGENFELSFKVECLYD